MEAFYPLKKENILVLKSSLNQVKMLVGVVWVYLVGERTLVHHESVLNPLSGPQVTDSTSTFHYIY